jgi:HD-GYP domain-containing protein (c-di-GMP phosphodiesterase class II)
MVRMSDVVRGIVRDKPAETGRDAPAPVAPPPPPPPRPRPVAEAPRPAPPAPVAERRAVEPRAVEPGPSLDTLPIDPAPPSERAEPLFAELQLFLARVRELIRTGDALPWPELEALIERCAVSLEASSELFWLANNTVAIAGVDYLAFHQARVAVLAMTIGASVAYDRPRRVQLGQAGSLIDVGLWQLPEGLLRRLDALSTDDQAQYRSHPRLSVELIRRWSPPREGLVEAVLQHHEREQGQGFPQGLHGAVSQDAKILGLVDTYTGLTMPPAPRPRLRPHEAIREIVRSRHEAFPSQLVKALLSEISVFPPGTLVRLNTGEVGRVTAVNRHHPLRPRVEIVADGKGQRLVSPKSTDLAEAPFLYITGAVAEAGR